jgi:hypothetical protein
MIGIYHDDFIDYLKEKLGPVRTTSKNIITPCPWCEYGKEKDHYHLYISLEAPIFHCFHAGCEQSGILRKFLKRIEGHDISDTFIDQNKLSEFKRKERILTEYDKGLKNVILPEIRSGQFTLKEMYLMKRLKFANIHLSQIKGLIFDVYEFIKVNQIPKDETLFRLEDYLHNNFIGFLTEHGTTAIFRNIDNTHSMRYYKLKIQQSTFVDYYKLPGNNPNSRKIVLSEGIFDIFSEHTYDNLNIKNGVKLYASALSSKYSMLVKSIVYYEQVFRPEVIILSDRGIKLQDYENLKFYNNHIIDTLKVYYNKTGKDFNDSPVTPVMEVIDNKKRRRRPNDRQILHK